MLREYEFTLITKGDLTEADNGKLLTDYEEIMIKDGGTIIKKDEWGTKRLSYPIKKSFRGYYTIYDYLGKAENLAEVERLMRIDDNVLRYMAVKLGGVCDVEERRADLAKKEAAEAERKQRK